LLSGRWRIYLLFSFAFFLTRRSLREARFGESCLWVDLGTSRPVCLPRSI
jgi:hypothetical protein